MNANMMDITLEVIEKLRSPEGCPWDLEHKIIVDETIFEETFELLEALDLALPKQEDTNHNQLLCEELRFAICCPTASSNSRRSRTIFKKDCFEGDYQQDDHSSSPCISKNLKVNTDSKGSILLGKEKKAKQEKKKSRLMESLKYSSITLFSPSRRKSSLRRF